MDVSLTRDTTVKCLLLLFVGFMTEVELVLDYYQAVTQAGLSAACSSPSCLQLAWRGPTLVNVVRAGTYNL